MLFQHTCNFVLHCQEKNGHIVRIQSFLPSHSTRSLVYRTAELLVWRQIHFLTRIHWRVLQTPEKDTKTMLFNCFEPKSGHFIVHLEGKCSLGCIFFKGKNFFLIIYTFLYSCHVRWKSTLPSKRFCSTVQPPPSVSMSQKAFKHKKEDYRKFELIYNLTMAFYLNWVKTNVKSQEKNKDGSPNSTKKYLRRSQF